MGEALGSLPKAVARALFTRPLIPAAVLVGLAEAEQGWSVLLTRRTPHLRDHGGQISLPGGRLSSVTESPADGALRESEEEVGLDPALVQIIGYLPAHPVVTGYAVCPVVGLLQPGFALAANPAEVAEIFWLPLSHLLDPAHWERGERTVGGIVVPVETCQFGPWHIWGATAKILQSLREQLYAQSQ